jgi:hypothetical protein
MSRRYGRQQRRQHRDRIAELDRRARYFEDQTYRVSRELQDCKDILARAARILGENHVALPAKEREYHERLPAMMAMRSDNASLYWRETNPMEPIRILTTMLDALRIEGVPDDFTGQVHFYATLHGKRVKYVISDLAIRNAPMAYLVEEIARQIATHLAAEFQQNTGSPA